MLQVIRFSAVLQCSTASSSASTTFVFALLFQCNSYLCTRCITRITSSKDLSLSLRVIALQCNSVNNAWAGICICTANDASWVLQAGMTWLFELCHHQCPASNTDALNTLRTKHPLFCIKTIGYFSPSKLVSDSRQSFYLEQVLFGGNLSGCGGFIGVWTWYSANR